MLSMMTNWFILADTMIPSGTLLPTLVCTDCFLEDRNENVWECVFKLILISFNKTEVN